MGRHGGADWLAWASQNWQHVKCVLKDGTEGKGEGIKWHRGVNTHVIYLGQRKSFGEAENPLRKDSGLEWNGS